MPVKLRENIPNNTLPFPKIMVDAYSEGIVLFVHNKEQATVLKHYCHVIGDYVGTATFDYEDLTDYDGIISDNWMSAITPDFNAEDIPHFNKYESDEERIKYRRNELLTETANKVRKYGVPYGN